MFSSRVILKSATIIIWNRCILTYLLDGASSFLGLRLIYHKHIIESSRSFESVMIYISSSSSHRLLYLHIGQYYPSWPFIPVRLCRTSTCCTLIITGSSLKGKNNDSLTLTSPPSFLSVARILSVAERYFVYQTKNIHEARVSKR